MLVASDSLTSTGVLVGILAGAVVIVGAFVGVFRAGRRYIVEQVRDDMNRSAQSQSELLRQVTPTEGNNGRPETLAQQVQRIDGTTRNLETGVRRAEAIANRANRAAALAQAVADDAVDTAARVDARLTRHLTQHDAAGGT